jgi:hypothetical protein
MLFQEFNDVLAIKIFPMHEVFQSRAECNPALLRVHIDLMRLKGPQVNRGDNCETHANAKRLDRMKI